MSYRSAFFVLLGVFVLHFSRILFYGEVIFPHDNSLEVGLPEKPNSTRISNRKFSDESSVFIPELANNFRSNRKGWVATWNPHVQLGRAAYQVSGLTRAYLITNALSRLTSDPFRVYTALVWFTIGLTGSFLLLFLRSLGLHPTAAVFSATGLAFGTLTSYWLTFVMFLSAICWLTCLLWLVAEFTQRPSPLRALGLAFATYSLFMTAYPQITILCLYITSAFALTRLAQMPRSRREKLQTMLALLGCAVAGALASLPVYLDLLFVAKDSARLGDVSDSFFLGVLPPCRNGREMASFLITIFDWSWLGNAIDPKYPLHFNGLSFTPVYGSLIWLSFILKNRRAVLFWQLLLIACLAGTIFPAVYLFAVHHLGFGLSRIQLLFGGIVPGFVLSAFTVDAIFRSELRLTIRSAAWFLAPLVAESVVALLVWHRLPINAVAVAATFLLVAALLGSIYWRSIPAFLGVAVVSAFLYGRALILSRPLDTIHVSSKLVDVIKAHTPGGDRFAIADSAITALPPNQEALFGLNSVNSYDSLSSRRYQELVRHWSAAGTGMYGRHFRFLDVRRALADQGFPFSGVHLILSARPLATDHLTLATEVNGIKLYETVTAPVDLLQTSHFKFSNGREAAIDPSTGAANLQPRRVEMLNDFQKIEVTASPQETLLFLSQQYHRAWRARAGQQPLRTVLVNRFYQGVIVPANTSEVELFFRPFVLWSWLPQGLFIFCAALLLARFLWFRRPDLSNPSAWARP
jgi:hypothetical protein